jgi:hypothetical protein
MATKTITDLSSVTSLTGSESIPIVQNGTTVRTTPNVLLSTFASSFLSSSGGTVNGDLKASGNISGSGTPSTTMTSGFVHVPKASGPPTGVPTAVTGYAPMYLDTTNNRLYVYNGSAWKYATLA